MKALLAKIREQHTGAALLATLLAALAVLGASGIAQGKGIGGYSLFWVLAFVGAALGALGFFSIAEKREKRCFLWLGVAFALALATGYRLGYAGGFGGLLGVGLVLMAGLGFGPAAGYGFFRLYALCLRLGDRPAGKAPSARKLFGIQAGVLFLCWLPVFMAYYPGLFAYDVMFQLPQVLDNAYRTDSPLLHTWLLGLFYRLGQGLGSPTTGMALYTLFQMAVLSLALSYALTYLYRQGVVHCVRVACLLFFALCPIFSMMAVSITKDGLFAASLLTVILWLHQGVCKPEKLRHKGFFFCLGAGIALTCLWRNNGILVFVGLLPVILGLLFPKRELRNRLLAVTLAGMALYGGSSLALTRIFQAQPGPLKEALSVPLQQVGWVYKNHGEEIDCAEEIEEFIPGVYAYVPTFADHIKAFANVGTGNVGEFAGLWAKLLGKYPLGYAEAFLFNCQGYWFVDDLSQARHYGQGLEGRQGYLLSDTKEGFGVEHQSLFPALETLYERLFSANEYQSLPVVSQIFSLAAYTWFLCFLMAGAACARRKDILLCGAALLLLEAGLLLGPCAIVRYQLPLMMGGPVLFGLLFGTPKRKRERNE